MSALRIVLVVLLAAADFRGGDRLDRQYPANQRRGRRVHPDPAPAPVAPVGDTAGAAPTAARAGTPNPLPAMPTQSPKATSCSCR